MHLRRLWGFATSPEQGAACGCAHEKLPHSEALSGLGFFPALTEVPVSTCCPVPALVPGLHTYSHRKGNLPFPPHLTWEYAPGWV